MRKVKTPEPEMFTEFWDVWRPHMRHTDGRGDARKAYRKHILDGAEPQDLVDGAKAYIRHHKTLTPEKQSFIPLAASWINKEAYADWCEKERAFQQHIQEQSERSPENVVSMPRTVRPNNHFLNRWEREKEAG